VVKIVDKSSMAMVHRMGQLRMVLPTFVSFPTSHAYREGGPGLVWDTCLQQLVEPNVDERERVMGLSSHNNDICPFYFRSFTSTSVGLSYGPELFDLDC
jgi:hypothetical protein